MSAPRAPSSRRSAAAGFTLFEALVSVALTALMIMAISVVTGQWLPNWHRGFGRVQRLESLDVGLQRLVEDLEAAEFVTANAASRAPLFFGDAKSVTLVRAAIGPDAAPHLEFVNLAETVDRRGFALVRSRAPYAPLAPDAPLAGQLRLADPVVLVRAPYRISFSFAGPDRLWRNAWRDPAALPTAVRVQVRDAASDQLLALSTAALVHVEIAAECVGQKSARQCMAGIAGASVQPAAGTPAP
jgi:general secretion pathway protein J